MATPTATSMRCALTQRLSSESREAIAGPRSSGTPARPSAVFSAILLFTSGLSRTTPPLKSLPHCALLFASPQGLKLINPVLRGWVKYFAVGHASECFGFVKDWVEKKIRLHMLRARNRQGFGWARWSRGWLYQTLKLFDGYRVIRPAPKAAPAG